MHSEAFSREVNIQEGGLQAVLVRTDAEYFIDLRDDVQDLFRKVLETKKEH